MYSLSIEFYKQEWKFGRTRTAVEHELQENVSTAFSLKLSGVFLYLDRNTENMFSISFRKH